MEAKLAKMVFDLDRQLSLKESHSSDSTAMSQLFDLCHNARNMATQLPAQTAEKCRSVLQTLHSGATRLQQLQQQEQQEQQQIEDECSGINAFEDEENLFSESKVFASVRQQEEETLALMQNREEEVQKLTDDIIALEQLFTNISDLVHEQGKEVEMIEDNVEQVEVHVENGKEALSKAVQSQKAARKKKVLLVVIGIIAAVIIIFLLFIMIKIYF